MLRVRVVCVVCVWCACVRARVRVRVWLCVLGGRRAEGREGGARGSCRWRTYAGGRGWLMDACK